MRSRRKLGMSIQHNPRLIHFVVLGQDGVGKSALTVRFLTRRFIGEYDQTLESTHRHHIDIEGTFVALELMDTAGKISDEKLDRCITFGDIFLVLYSITDRSSFKEAGRIARYIRKKKTLDSTSLAIAGTKRDLAHRRQVEEADGNRLTTSTNCSFYEISISENFSDTHDMIHDILRQYLSSHRPNEGSTATTGSSMEPSSPLSTHKEIKPSSSSSWARLKRTPFRRKSVQTAVC